LEVFELYRCLLGRGPENGETIAAFQTYYPSYARGRKAIFDSVEFQNFYASVTGRPPHGMDNAAASLALAFLKRVGAVMPGAPAGQPAPTIRNGLSVIFSNVPRAKTVLVLGESPVALDDLVPLARSDAAVMQIAANLPPMVPATTTLRGGATLFRLAATPDSLLAILADADRHIDALFITGLPAGPDWIGAIRSRLSAQALVVVGPAHDGFPAHQLSTALETLFAGAPVQDFAGMKLHHVGGWKLPVSYAPPSRKPKPPSKSAYPKLALAAIMRDEAACIENMLRSVVPVASFVALLDTGSSDATMELARTCLAGSGVPHVLRESSREDFNNDFSAMRNAALALLPPDMDWVLMLDADEELVAEDYEDLLRLTADAGYDAVALPRYNFPGADKTGQVLAYPDRQIRLLRLGAGLRYSGRVHETIQGVAAFRPPLDETAMGGARGGPHIHHLVRRFRNAEQEARKQAFYRQLAQS
jgi:hypothetical protein